MIQELKIRRLRAKTLFSIYFIGALLTVAPIFLLGGLSAMFGAGTLKMGDVPVHGWRALGVSLIMPPLFALAVALWSLLMTWLGLWLYSKFRTITISFYSDDA